MSSSKKIHDPRLAFSVKIHWGKMSPDHALNVHASNAQMIGLSNAYISSSYLLDLFSDVHIPLNVVVVLIVYNE